MTRPDPATPSTRQEIEQLFGRCVLRLQAYELLMKSIVARHRVSGSFARAEDALTRRINETRLRTMGYLVGEMMESFLVPAGQEGFPDSVDASSGSGFTMRMQIALPTEEFARIETEHRALVTARNALVHHFLDDHDLQSEAGCRAALEALAAVLAQVTRAHADLQTWAADMEATRKALADRLASSGMRDWIVKGRVPWPATMIVQALQNACTALAQCGWTSVDAAKEWIATHYPDESPEGYGCRTWRHVIHDSGLFDLRVRKVDGRRHAWYRPRAPKPETP